MGGIYSAFDLLLLALVKANCILKFLNLYVPGLL